jgi:hypothetical protein
MATNNPKELEGQSVSNYAVAHDTHLNSEARHDVVEKEEERKTSSENLWIICNVEDIYRERNHWYKFGRTTVQQGPPRISSKHFNCFTYNDLIEWNSGETVKEAFNVKVAHELVELMEYSKEVQFFPFHNRMHPFPVIMVLLWHQMLSGLKRSMEAEADTWILNYKDLFEYKDLQKYSTHSNFYHPAVYCVCGG